MKIEIKHNIDRYIRAFKGKVDRRRKAFRLAIEWLMDTIYNDFKRRLNERFLTLEEMKKLDHPYAIRHYVVRNVDSLAWRLNRIRVYNTEKPKNLAWVNRQTGDLVASLEKEKITMRNYTVIRVGIRSDHPYAKYVFYGTRKMIPRPIHLFLMVVRGKYWTENFKMKFIEYAIKTGYAK